MVLISTPTLFNSRTNSSDSDFLPTIMHLEINFNLGVSFSFEILLKN